MKTIRLQEFDYSDENLVYFVMLRFEVCISEELMRDVYRMSLRLFESTDFVSEALVVLPDHMHFLTQKASSSNSRLSDLVCVLKSKVLYELKKVGSVERSFWQRNYYEHVIRNEADYLEKVRYIVGHSLKVRSTNEDQDYDYLFVRGIEDGATQGRPLRGTGRVRRVVNGGSSDEET